MPYRDTKYITNPKIEKEKLRQKLKKFIRSNIENAKKVDKILEDLESAKYIYQIKELLRFNIITINNGMYKYNTNPLGVSTESLIKYFIDNPDFYKELQMMLQDALKKEL